MVSSPLLTVSLHTICSLGLGGTRQIKEHNGYFCSVLGELKHSLHFCPSFPPGSLLGIGSSFVMSASGLVGSWARPEGLESYSLPALDRHHVRKLVDGSRSHTHFLMGTGLRERAG